MGLSGLQYYVIKLQELLGDRFEHFDSFENHLLFWVGSCGRITLALCLIVLRITYVVDVWESRKARLYDTNLSFPQPQC